MPTGVYKRTKFHKQRIKEASNKGRFKKGHFQSNTGKTHFSKGFIPWNKNKKCPQTSGKNNVNWKNGIKKHKDGYIYILKPYHLFCNINGYIFEHRLIMEKYFGRYLTKKEIVHHLNGIKDDNRIENLILFKNYYAHLKYHHIQEGMKEGEIIFDGRKF